MTNTFKKMAKSLIFVFFFILSLFRINRRRPDEIRVIFVLAAGWLGDTFLAVQTIREIRKRYPEAKIFAGVRTPFAKVLLENLCDYIETDSVPSDRKREKFSLKKLISDAKFVRKTLKPDVVIDLMCNRYSALFSFMASKYTCGSDIDFECAPLYSVVSRKADFPADECHIAYKPWHILSGFFNGRTVPRNINPLPPEGIKPFITGTGDRKMALIVPGAGWAEKEWGTDNFKKLAVYLALRGLDVVLSGSEKERDLCNKIADGIGRVVIGNLEETLQIAAGCTVFIGNDSGVSHIAASFGRPCISIFTVTEPALCAPLGKQSFVFVKPSADEVLKKVMELLK